MKFIKAISPLIFLASLYLFVLASLINKQPYFPLGDYPDFYYHLSASYQFSIGSLSYFQILYPPLTQILGASFILLSESDPLLFFKSGFALLSALAIPLLYIVSKDLSGDSIVSFLNVLLYILFSPIWYYSQVETFLYPTMIAFIIFLSTQIFYTRMSSSPFYTIPFAISIILLLTSHYYVLPLAVLYILAFLILLDVKSDDLLKFFLYKSFHSTRNLIYYISSFLIIVIPIGLAFILLPDLPGTLHSMILSYSAPSLDQLIAPNTLLSSFTVGALSDLFKLGKNDIYTTLILTSLPALAIFSLKTPWPKPLTSPLPLAIFAVILIALTFSSQSWRTTHALFFALTPLAVYPLLLIRHLTRRRKSFSQKLRPRGLFTTLTQKRS